MVSVSLCMIVKNEEDVLVRCLESAADLVEEIVIVDTGSTDSTREIAARFTGQVYDFPWRDDFAAARNESFARASMDYCLWLDADDVLLEADREAFLKLKETLDPAVNVVMAPYHVGFDGSGRVTFSYYRERLIKNRAGMRWEGAVHETVTPAGRIVYGDFAVTHRKTRPSDPDRNLRIYEAQLAAGRELDPSGSTMAGSCITTGAGKMPWRSSGSFWQRARDGWRTTSTPAVTAPTVWRRWTGPTRRWRRCSGPSPTTGPGPRPAVRSAGGSSSGNGTARRSTGTPWRWPVRGMTAGEGSSRRTATATCPASSCACVTAVWEI